MSRISFSACHSPGPRWRDIARRHAPAIAEFVCRLVLHRGQIDPRLVYRVHRSAGGIRLEHPTSISGDFTNGGIRIPGEETNSFCTLYEVGYFVNALFLSAVTSALPIEDYRGHAQEQGLALRVVSDIFDLSSDRIDYFFKNPRVPIVSWLTDDVEPYRFRKEMLWGLAPESHKKILARICKGEMGRAPTDELRDILWNAEDEEIAASAMLVADDLCRAKMVQYYLALEAFLVRLGVNLDRVPFYFFSSPKNEIADLGPDHPFLELLVALHSPWNLNAFSRITRQEYPVLIKLPCPACGESSKKILQGRVKGRNKRTVRLVCSPQPKIFRNEHDLNTWQRAGCGHSWEYSIPDSGPELYHLLAGSGASLHIALANLLQVFTNTAQSPVAHVLCDLNLRTGVGGALELYLDHPDGYGSSAQLFTSVMGVQLGIFSRQLATGFVQWAQREGILTEGPFMILAHRSPSRLFVPHGDTRSCGERDRGDSGPSDLSIFKALERMPPLEVVERSIDLCYYPADLMMRHLRGVDIADLPPLGRRRRCQ